MNSRSAVRLVGLAMGLFLAFPAAGQETALAQAVAAEPLNVLLITADDLGLEIGPYGESRIATPNLDRLAGMSTVFDVAWVTSASCSPSRSSLFTGLYPHTNGQYGLVGTGAALHPEFADRNLFALLAGAGYRTGLAGKLHVAPETAFPHEAAKRPETRMRDVVAVGRDVGEFLDRGAEEPFFLLVSFADPHASFGDEQPAGGFPARVEDVPADVVEPGPATILEFQGVDSPGQRQRTADYLSAVARTDTGVGHVLDQLETRGLMERTLVVFLGDHGPGFDRAKASAYEAGLRVPLLVRWPAVSRAARTAALVSTADVFPTVLEAARLPVPTGLHGRSLRPLLEEPSLPWREHLFGEFHMHGKESFFPRRAVRDGRYKLIHNLMAGEVRATVGIDGDRAYRDAGSGDYRGTPIGAAFRTLEDPPELELYDLETDPFERTNLAGLPEHREVEARLRAALDRWRVETADPLLDDATVRRWAREFGTRREVLPYVLALFGVLAAITFAYRLTRRRSRVRRSTP